MHNIAYVTHGPNVRRGTVAIKCPWCGASDPSEHLTVNLTTGVFGCWRNKIHSGRNPAKLIQALLKCSWEQANRLSGRTIVIPSDFLGKVKGTLQKEEKQLKPTRLSLPPEFKHFSTRPSSRPFVEYLRQRNFSDLDIALAKCLDIWYDAVGPYKGRIIFTIWFESKLVGWTGRTIYENETIRYKTLSSDPEKESVPASAPISNFLLFYDQMMESGARNLVLVEGPFDAWKINVLGKDSSIFSTCFFTSMISKAQIDLLHGIVPRFDNVFLLLDQGTISKSLRIQKELVSLKVQVRHLPHEVKDPALLTSTEQLRKILGV